MANAGHPCGTIPRQKQAAAARFPVLLAAEVDAVLLRAEMDAPAVAFPVIFYAAIGAFWFRAHPTLRRPRTVEFARQIPDIIAVVIGASRVPDVVPATRFLAGALSFFEGRRSSAAARTLYTPALARPPSETHIRALIAFTAASIQIAHHDAQNAPILNSKKRDNDRRKNLKRNRRVLNRSVGFFKSRRVPLLDSSRHPQL